LIFTKLMKVPVAPLRQLHVILIIYLDDILLIARSASEVIQSRDTLIFLLQNLGFVINIKKSVVDPVQIIEFLDNKVKPKYSFVWDVNVVLSYL